MWFFISSSSVNHVLTLLTYLLTVQVFFSSYVFSTNVMVKVATRPAVNPVSCVSHFILCIHIQKNMSFTFRCAEFCRLKELHHNDRVLYFLFTMHFSHLLHRFTVMSHVSHFIASHFISSLHF